MLAGIKARVVKLFKSTESISKESDTTILSRYDVISPGCESERTANKNEPTLSPAASIHVETSAELRTKFTAGDFRLGWSLSSTLLWENRRFQYQH
jgi:hypothetical protein